MNHGSTVIMTVIAAKVLRATMATVVILVVMIVIRAIIGMIVVFQSLFDTLGIDLVDLVCASLFFLRESFQF